ncbi:MAG: DUF3293 domain-containing protein [Candidatus Wenzhouxiangella sp. M2_3B_020]
MHEAARQSEPDLKLLAAFEATEYRVETPSGPRTVRIGARDEALDRLLDRRRWAIVTAHNPGGRCIDQDANRRAAERLTARIRALEPDVMWPSRNHDPEGRWPDEPGWLFSPVSLADVDGLARGFGQAAVVVGGPDAPACLRVYSGGEPERVPTGTRTS